MFYQCWRCGQDIETNFEETHYHLRSVIDWCGIETTEFEITLCKDCYELLKDYIKNCRIENKEIRGCRYGS